MSNKEIIREWYSLYADDIYNYLIYYLNDKSDVEDILQEVFIRAIRNLDNFKGNSHPKTWLIQIARNIAIDQSRKQKRLSNLFSKITNKHQTTSLETSFIDNENILELYKNINRLPTKYREIVIMRGILELSTKEVSQITGNKESNINLLFHRAKLKLKENYFEGGSIRNESV
ncbi:RNA polymerase sigma factor [Cytobacillus horneckiae]|uniref:RNA polymerase sigma factor n=1 Tax=Cytobacillus horneckiae TaxID=549687 RepID=A0A2N0ZB52_9BACI|nr:RNA polymerase sigma factor [Cytobacillus horneckiae]MEC1155532.1 RNA polymerase sigma factor [Cytobacillus horneckiae]MED2936851.1 RNA polymerase sigma factor [Cytobacillus horneckiae]PKG26729.1 RNA polymerase sigma factor [Cytobacillus horneckiae]